MTKKPTTISEDIVNRGWKLVYTENNKSQDRSLLLSNKVGWCYKCRPENKAEAWMHYSKELNTKPEKRDGYYTTLRLNFTSLEYYNSIKKSIGLKQWKLIQDEVSENMLFKSWNQGLYTITLTIETKDNIQFFSLWLYTRNPSKD